MDLLLQFARGLLQLFRVLLQSRVGLGHLRNVTSCAINAQQVPLVITDRNQLQLIVELVAAQEAVEGTLVIRRFINLRQVGVFQVIERQVRDSQHALNRDMGVNDRLDVTTNGL